GPHRLGLDLEKPPHLLHIEAPQPDPVESRDPRLPLGRKPAPGTCFGVDEFGRLAGIVRRGDWGLIDHADRLSAPPCAGNDLCGAARLKNDGNRMSWTEERIAILTKMWEGGATASQIAD